jgi:phage antirepressor YoqD-like protein
MNDLIGLSDLANEMSKAMTVKQVAEALGTAESTIRNKASELFPDIVHNGIATLLSEEQVFEIKENLVPRDLTLKSKVDSALTSLDIEKIADRISNMMTIGEVSEALGVSRDLVEKRVQELIPNKMHKGVTTFLDESEVTAIKLRISQNSHLATSDDRRRLSDMPKTELEMMILDKQVSEWKSQKIEKLQLELKAKDSELAIAAPKVESFDALMHSEKTMSITDAAKHFNLHPRKEVFPYLFARGYLTRNGLPTQDAIDADYLSLREAKCEDGEVRKQAVVETRQLETWRTRVVPQIKAWVSKE